MSEGVVHDCHKRCWCIDLYKANAKRLQGTIPFSKKIVNVLVGDLDLLIASAQVNI